MGLLGIIKDFSKGFKAGVRGKPLPKEFRMKPLEGEPMCSSCGEEPPYPMDGRGHEPDNPWCKSCTFLMAPPSETGVTNEDCPGEIIY